MNAPIDTFGDEATLKRIGGSFGYVILPPRPPSIPATGGWYLPCLTPDIISRLNLSKQAAWKCCRRSRRMARVKTLGLRFGKFAYSDGHETDFRKKLSEALKGIDNWVVDLPAL